MDQLEIKNSETQAIVDLASQIKPVEMACEHGHKIKRVALPPEWTLKQVDDGNLLPTPARKLGETTLTDTDSFIDYINRHKIADLSVIYCQADYTRGEVSFRCIFNDHAGTPEGQQWQDFKANYTPIHSEEWMRWTKNNGKEQSQFDFATFIEKNLADIAQADGMPTGTQLLEMALSFEANQDKRFKSSIRLQSGGLQLNFVEDDDAQTIQQMKLFERIAIGISVFWNGDAYQITARLRYRVQGGKLVFWYELIRQDKVIEDATKKMINRIKEATGIPLFFGEPHN